MSIVSLRQSPAAALLLANKIPRTIDLSDWRISSTGGSTYTFLELIHMSRLQVESGRFHIFNQFLDYFDFSNIYGQRTIPNEELNSI